MDFSPDTGADNIQSWRCLQRIIKLVGKNERG
jgi:hypothetical protein